MYSLFLFVMLVPTSNGAYKQPAAMSSQVISQFSTEQACKNAIPAVLNSIPEPANRAFDLQKSAVCVANTL